MSGPQRELGCVGARGVTLIEILLAVALVAVAILALIGLNTGGLRLMNRGRAQVNAIDLAERQLNSISELGYSQIKVGKPYAGSPAEDGFPPTPYPSANLEGNRYNLAVEAYQQDDNLIRVRVLVTFQGQQRSLARYYSR
ncbi:MAG: prepilin-type N-terminal cleavage/methylation domain-containing protein [Vulcanimicrobiota bacterium]